MKPKLMSIALSLIFSIGLSLWAYMLKKDNEKLELQLEQGIEYQEKLERNIEVLIDDYDLSIEALTDMINEKESLNRELNKKRLEIKGRKDDKEANPMLIDTSEYILDRLREQKADRDN